MLWELAVYLQDQWQVADDLTAELGARATSFLGSFGSVSGVDPRFALISRLPGDARIYTTITVINQFLHPFRNTGVFYYYPTVFWYPSNADVKQTTSFHVTAGVERSWENGLYVASAEGYFRTTNNYHGFPSRQGQGDGSVPGSNLIFGTERAYGGTIALRKRFGEFSGSVQYTLSWLRDAFPGYNGGQTFASLFDRRHELEITAVYSPSADWSFSSLCVLVSNPPLTISAFAPATSKGVSSDISITETFRGVLDANGSRMPGFQRLEFTINRRVSFGGMTCLFSLRMLNAFGLLDPFRWTLLGESDPAKMWIADLRDLNLFPLYPSVGMTVRF